MFKAIFFHGFSLSYGNYNFTSYDFLYYTEKTLKWQASRVRLRHTIFPTWRGTTGGGKLTLPTPNLLPAGKEKEYYGKGGVSGNRAVLENKAGSILQSAVESLARTLLPQMQAFFESEQGKQTLKEWHEERERHS